MIHSILITFSCDVLPAFMIYRGSMPLLVSGLLAYFNPDDSNTTELRYAYMYGSGIILSLLMTMILQHSSIENNLQCAMKMRVACCSIIFRKVNLILWYCDNWWVSIIFEFFKSKF